MKNVNLLGMKLRDRYVRESLILTERFLCEGAVHTILYLTPPVLLEAVKCEEEKVWIESADLTLWGDTEILEAAEITARGRHREVQEKEFLKIFLRRMARAHRSILVLSDREEDAEALKQELLEIQADITVVGTMTIPDIEEKQEDILNKINMIVPTVIVARMPFPLQQAWLAQSKAYINTEIWIGLPEHLSCIRKKEMPVTRIGKKILNALFNKQVSKYKK